MLLHVAVLGFSRIIFILSVSWDNPFMKKKWSIIARVPSWPLKASSAKVNKRSANTWTFSVGFVLIYLRKHAESQSLQQILSLGIILTQAKFPWDCPLAIYE